jgi:peptide/nickel transport system ATP-binding protein
MYTKRLLAAVPVPDPDEQQTRRIERDALLAESSNATGRTAVRVQRPGISGWSREATEP